MKHKRILVVVIALAMLFSMTTFFEINTSAAIDVIPLNNWSFTQGGQYNINQKDDAGYIDSVILADTDEVIDGWLTGTGSENQTKTTSDVSAGFELIIDDTGFDADYSSYPYRLNPWSIRAHMNGIAATKYHTYIVTFKAKASKKKYCYVDFNFYKDGVQVEGPEYVSESENRIITLTEEEETFSFEFYNIDADEFDIELQFGSFSAQYDFDGNDVSDIIDEPEYDWNGTVYVNDFTIEDEWFYSPMVDETTTSELEPTTVNEESSTTVNVIEQEVTTKVKLAKTKVKKAIKATESKKIKISLKKINGVSGYQIQISKKKNFNSVLIKKKVKKISFTVSSKRVKKLKKIFVRARVFVKKNGKTRYGDWSKAKRVKIK